MPFRVRLDVPEVPGDLARAAEIVREESERAAALAGIRLRAALVEASPVGGTALLRNSWTASSPEPGAEAVEVRVSSSAGHALPVEEGARPHFPFPRGALSQWIRRKLGISAPSEIRKAEYGISLAIARRGLPVRRVFARAVEIVKPEIDRLFDVMADRIDERLTEGA